MGKQNILKLAVCILISELAGLLGSVFTLPSISAWYSTLNKPFFTPPNWFFGPVWTSLFLLMGISLFLVWKKGFRNKKLKIGITFFSIQLALNVSWSILFFGLHKPFYAMVEISVLWVFILLTAIQFKKIDKKAAYLLIPYLVWVAFAGFLNYSIWIMNI